MTSLKLVHRLDSLTDWPLWDHELKRRADAEGLWPYIEAISALNSSIEYVDDQEEALTREPTTEATTQSPEMVTAGTRKGKNRTTATISSATASSSAEATRLPRQFLLLPLGLAEPLFLPLPSKRAR
ncbi:hypothetical protein G3M48_009004 [Beauveria asiatica]|uniref:Uncharacterized protein n=1 Tax=Beauveria asiatica TaxID=1069075 RepID=A0AAW0RK22_9HYPO